VRHLAASFALLAAACGGEAGPGSPDAGPVVSLLVDTNRDGVLTAGDVDGEDGWTAERGAVFVANVDDDDGDGDADADDTVVNGAADALDLARVQLTAWADAPVGAHATLEIDAAAADHIRWFRQDGSTWTDVGVAVATLDMAALQAGASFGIEGLALLQDDTWDGRATLSLTVYDSADETLEPVVSQSAVLRQAPVVVGWNTAPTLRVFASDVGDFGGSDLLSQIASAAGDAGVDNVVINGLDPDYLTQGSADQWTQDFFEIGAMYMPIDGGMNRMGVGIRLKPYSAAGEFVEKELFAPDFGALYRFSDPYDFGDGAALDLGGNLDVVPPHEGYPVGRLIMDSTPARHPDSTYFATLEAQYAQTPVLKIDGSWLVVGHTDEVLSFVADPSSARGWKAVIHAPREAWQMLLDLVAADPANGSLVLFAGKVVFDWITGAPVAADRTVDEILADADLAAAQDTGQAHADEMRALLKAEVGLADADFVEMPFLWETVAAAPDGGLRHVAYSPGTANLFTFNGQAIVASPFGPFVDGEDAFEKVARERLEALGLTVRFVDDWDLYHRLEGEVHCGSNAERTLPDGAAWWEMSR
jgi:protein-arginine deiminase